MTLIHVFIQAIRSAVSTITGIKPFSFNTIHPAEVQKALNELNPRKAYGQDKISPRILKLLSNEMARSLCKIFNTAIESSKWPEDWKRGTWTPVFKKGNKQDVRNYGPITVIPTAGKIYEKLLCDQISNHMDPILSPNITAYRKNHSCDTTLLRLVEKRKKELDCGKVIAVLSTDMSKALDSLYSPLPIKKLEA